MLIVCGATGVWGSLSLIVSVAVYVPGDNALASHCTLITALSPAAIVPLGTSTDSQDAEDCAVQSNASEPTLLIVNNCAEEGELLLWLKSIVARDSAISA